MVMVAEVMGGEVEPAGVIKVAGWQRWFLKWFLMKWFLKFR